MSLKEYTQKRDFSKTSEPKSEKGKESKQLTFVIQKHDASSLHYDFRLEMAGVLKSWAVPKGPSTDPKNKRLAMMVEDHPYDYRKFEGIIPKGSYGGGTVIVWDEGVYEPIEEIKGKKAAEKHLLKQLKAGSLKIRLHGQKLKGEFALVKTHGMAENAWLLIKHKDEYASTKDVTKLDQSVLSKKTIEKMKETTEKVWKNGPDMEVTDLLKKAPKSNIPTNIKPMLATLVDKPFDDPDWVYEIKWDGYRALAFINQGNIELLSRNKKKFNDKFYPVYDALREWKINAVIDGEIVVVDGNGISNFGRLQNWRTEADGDLAYCVFDLLWYEGKSLMDMPLNKRQEILKSILPVADQHIRPSKVFTAKGLDFFDAATRIGLEGIIAKKSDSIYTSDYRSNEWLKIKIHKSQEVVIAGYTKNRNSPKQFSGLLLGVYENGVLKYVGKVGTGFSNQLQKEMMDQFKPLVIDKNPFEILPDIDNIKVTWLKPELVCEVAFSEVTTDGVFRHPSFKGVRIDKKAKLVIREIPVQTEAVVAEAKAESTESPVKEKGKKTLLNPKDETQVKKVAGHELKFTHLSKIYWPEDRVTKRDMFNYYHQVAPYIIPYIKDRPMSLNRFPNGIHGPSFYQKDVKGKAPEWAKTFPYTNGEGEHKEYLVGTDETSLLWMASLGCIEINPWFSRIQSEGQPDYCVIDLDPDKNTFEQVIIAANEVKKILDAIDVPSFCKTSGSTGIHVYIPMAAKYSYEQSQMFARIIVNIVHKQIPEFTTLERMIADREGKMYLDFMQNRPGATIAGPYSLRPKVGATVSMPLHWDEVKSGLSMKDFTIFNAIDRLKTEGDLFKGVLGKGIDLMKTIKKAQSIFG